MVPLNPNELSREPLKDVLRGITSTGIWNGFDDTIDDRCAFSLHNKNVIDTHMCRKHRRQTLAVEH